MMIMKCWELLPENRPSFKELYMNTSQYIERIAGYLEMGYNPFAGIGFSGKIKSSADEMNTEEEEQEIESAVVIKVTPVPRETSSEENII